MYDELSVEYSPPTLGKNVLGEGDIRQNLQRNCLSNQEMVREESPVKPEVAQGQNQEEVAF